MTTFEGAVTVSAALPNRGLPGMIQQRAAAGDFPGLHFAFVPADGPGAEVMPRMIAELAYDVCDMSPSSLLIAAERGVPIAALPCITLTGFPFGEIVVRTNRIRDVRDLAGARIGVRTWTNPVKPWLAGILAHDYGVDLTGVTWVPTVPDPIPGVALPPNARRSEGRSLNDLLAAGEIDAAISPGKGDVSGVAPLFADPFAEARAWHSRSGIVPVMHLPAVKRSFAAEHPAALAALVAGIRSAKRAYDEVLATHDPASLDAQARADAALLRDAGIDPVPFGLAHFRASFERLGAYMVEQGYLAAPPALDALFIREAAAA